MIPCETKRVQAALVSAATVISPVGTTLRAATDVDLRSHTSYARPGDRPPGAPVAIDGRPFAPNVRCERMAKTEFSWWKWSGWTW